MMVERDPHFASLLDAERNAPDPGVEVQARVLARVEASIASGAGAAAGASAGSAGSVTTTAATAAAGKLLGLGLAAAVVAGAGLFAWYGQAEPGRAPQVAEAPASVAVPLGEAPSAPTAMARTTAQDAPAAAATAIGDLPPAPAPAAEATRPLPDTPAPASRRAGASGLEVPQKPGPRPRPRAGDTARRVAAAVTRPAPSSGPSPTPPEPTPEPAGPPEAELTPAPAPTGGLSEELGLLRQARAALNRGAADAALTHATQHLERFPDGVLAEEREALAVSALARGGELAAAKARARRFEARYPHSVMLPAVRAATARQDPP